MEKAGRQSSQRPAGREHWPLYPKHFVAIRIVQLALALIALALTAYGVTYLPFTGAALLLFTAVASLISSVYHIVAEFGAPLLYNYWAVLGIDIFLVVFWLLSFAVLASQVGLVFAVSTTCWDGYCETVQSSSATRAVGACLAAAAALGAFEFALFITSLVIHSIRLHRHRAAGLHCVPLTSTSRHHGAGHVPGAPGDTIQLQAQAPQAYAAPAPAHAPAPAPQDPVTQPPATYSAVNRPSSLYAQPMAQQSVSPLSAQQTGSSQRPQGYEHQTQTPSPYQHRHQHEQPQPQQHELEQTAPPHTASYGTNGHAPHL